jgi:hypothetical protein
VRAAFRRVAELLDDDAFAERWIGEIDARSLPERRRRIVLW